VEVRDDAGVVGQDADPLADAEGVAGFHRDDAVLLAQVVDPAPPAEQDPVPARAGRSRSLDRVLLPASTTARPAAGTLTTVATTVSAQSSGWQVPSATWDASWNT
jgi:hypothetical protein